jgi:3-oxoacyl-[acyl-carrier-protein] synthase II
MQCRDGAARVVTGVTSIAAVSAFWPSGRGVADLARVVDRGNDADPAHRIDDARLTEALSMKGLRPLSRAARLAMVAAVDAWPPGVVPGPRDAIVLGMRAAGVEPLADFVRQAATNGPHMVFPMSFPNTVASVHAGYVAILLGITGPNITMCGDDAGLDALARGLALIEAGRADRVLVLSAEAADPTVVSGDPGVTDGAAAVLLERPGGSEVHPLAVVHRASAEVLDGIDRVDNGAIRASVGDTGPVTGCLAVALATWLVGYSGRPVLVGGNGDPSCAPGFRLEPIGR